MSKDCDYNSKECEELCDEREEEFDFKAKLNPNSKINKIIGVISGKGGVGKSIITSMLAVLMKRRDYNVAIMDGDITGPSIPKLFGLKDKVYRNELGILPLQTKTGIEVISINLLLDDVTDPVIWRGPIVGNMVKSFYEDVLWHDIDFMFIDMPPGTGDVALTSFQSLPLDGLVVVTSPQELASLIVSKAVKMAQMMNIPIIGVVENMSYFKCPDNNKNYYIFGESHLEEISKQYNLKVLGRVPIEPKLATLTDAGSIELFSGKWLDEVPDILEKL